MNLPFSQNHISYDAQKRVKQILSPLSKMAGISYFNYSITYENRTHFTLHTNANYYESWFLNEYPMWESHIKSGWYLCESINDKDKIDKGLSFGHGNGIIHINHFEDRSEVIAFATSPENRSVLNFYLNNLNLLQRFKNHFEEEAADLIGIASSQLIDIPLIMTNNENFVENNFSIHDKKPAVNDHFDSSRLNLLSVRELECYSYLIRGYGLSYISNQLNIAIPTVSNYISRIKQKLKCSKKEEMLLLAEKENIVEFYL